jgi:BTB/POZ domain.
MKVTGPCLKKLNRLTAVKLLKRLILIKKSNVFEKMALSFFESAHQNKITHNMKIEEQNLMLNVLYSMSAKPDKVGSESALLFNIINSDMKTLSL